MPLPSLLPPNAGALPFFGLTVLAVEDSRFFSECLRLMCRRLGARLRRADTLGAARLHLRTYRPDALLVDLGLPDGRGEALIAELANDPRRPSVILAISGDAEGHRTAIAAGADGFLTKPLRNLDALRAALQAHLPDRVAPVTSGTEADPADPMALKDDLSHAADLLAGDPDASARRYLASFLAGVSMQSGDRALEAVARDAGKSGDLASLARLVTARLGASAVL
jgi:CheY-like chemotaxis protein